MANKKLAAEARLYVVLRKSESLTEEEQSILATLENIEGVKVTAEASGKSKAVDQAAEIAAAVSALEKAAIFVLDLETIGTTGEKDAALDALTNRIEGVGVGVGKGKKDAWWFPFIPSRPGEQVYSQVQVFRALEPILKDPNKSLLNSNPKFDLKCLKVQGVDVENKIIDTVIADWLLDENQKRHGLKEIIEREYGIKTVSWAEAKKAAAVPGSEEAFREYALNDVKFAFMAWDKLEKRLKKEPQLLKLFHEVEMELIPIFVELELAGVRIDRDYLSFPDPDFPNDPTKGTGLLQILNKEKAEAEARARAALGRDIDISKSQQVSVALFGIPTLESLREASVSEKIIANMTGNTLFFINQPGLFPIPLDKKRKPILPGKNGYYSTDDGILSYLAGHPFIDAVLDWRWADKLISTYVESYLQKSIRDGRVHPDFNQAGTVTGRFCVSDKTMMETSAGIYRISELHLTKEREISIITHRGRPRRILGVYFLGREEMFRVTLDNGSWIEGTAGHRVETPYGWMSIYELSEGEEVFSPRDPSRKGGDKGAALCTSGRCFQEDIGRGHPGKGSPPEVSDKPTHLVHVEGSIQGQVRSFVQTAASEQTGKGSGGQPERRASTGEDCPEGENSGNGGSGLQPFIHVQKTENERVSCEEEHHHSRLREVGGTAEENTGNGHGNASVAGRSFTWIAGGFKALQRKAAGVLRGVVRGLRKAFPTSMVHPITGGQLPLFEGEPSDTQEPYNVEPEQIRVAAFAGSSRCGNPTRSPVFYREIHDGFCLPESEGGGRGGWGIPQDGCYNAETGYKEGSESDFLWVEGASLYNETGGEGTTKRHLCYTTATIASIKSVGEQDVWDIEVEEDHSFIANGFVNHNTCSDPNLQQIPTEKGKYSIKKMFVPEPGNVFICGDFNQLQFRLVGHFAKRVLGRSRVAEAYIAGSDLHTKTQTELHFKERKPAKTVNFGFIFGRMPDGFSYDNHIPIDDAKKFFNHFHRTYPELDQMYDWVKEELCEKGYVSSFTGRRRRFPKYKGMDPNKREGGLWWDSRSTAWNAMVQGAEGDVVRISMRNIHREIKKRRKVDPRWENVKLKVQVHDEMVYEAPAEIAEEVAKMVREEAEKCLKLAVPLIFETGISANNWEEAKK